MITQSNINEITNILARKAKLLFGDKLKDVILFGSCARGEFADESDVDLMFLVDMDRINLSRYKSDICKISSELGMEYNVLVSPILQDMDEFNRFKGDLSFFRNVELEGVRISVQ
ncbi:nucleotidyltransferase-like protein [Anaerobacterium chartisolvens]|uniref:Nucleotidyltransferase-like protein n=1 Tax=Anaerobacterium chartisolvens TaxID=1297424 RepID=A0A369BHF5_9FIRM|nr:nucleotidyltransferase domain-containing protein [Anaerobacterium chartisolvens]RCX20992.1 nucleotidyltransferase-like protein [Anaerobacterium chartisolvens]